MRAILSDKGVRWVSFGWTAFIAENLIVSENRDYIISLYNERQYHTLYNTLSSAACAGLLYAYIANRKRGPVLPPASSGRKAFAFLLQTVGIVGLSQLAPRVRSPFAPTVETTQPSVGPPSVSSDSSKIQFRCPMDFRAADIPADGVFLMDRVTRHPSLWFASFVSFSAALNAVYATKVAMFSFPIVFAYIGGWHQDQRHLRGSGGYLAKEKYSITSNVPFVALIQGKQSWKDLASEVKETNLGLAVFVSSVIFVLRKAK